MKADQELRKISPGRPPRACRWLTPFLLFGGILSFALMNFAAQSVFPGKTWELRTPAEAGLDSSKLDQLRDLVRGRGCVVRHGYLVYSWGDISKSSDVASAMKPVISTLLLMAVQDGLLQSVDDKVSAVEPRLKEINNGKDAAITWRHLASQTSGYGLEEPPGTAYSYNDYAITLYYDSLMKKVYRTNGTAVLHKKLAEPLAFEDDHSFDAFRRTPKDGRLALSVRDFARFGLLYLQNGKWHDQQILRPDLVNLALHSPIPASLKHTSGVEKDMIPGQHSIGGKKDITPVGPGFYSFNWWLNGTNSAGQRLFPSAPPEAYVASGHGGIRTMWTFPSLDLIVSWNDADVKDHDDSPGNPKTKCNQAVSLIMQSAAKP